MEISKKLLEAMRIPFVLENYEIFLGTSIGIAFSSGSGDIDRQLKDAFHAMRQSMDLGGGIYTVHSPEAKAIPQFDLSLVPLLSQALKRGAASPCVSTASFFEN